MGNSEVGHLNLGAGQVVRQDLTRIDDAIEDGSFLENRVLRDACARPPRSAGRLHLLGLVSAGGVHSSMDHLRALIEMASSEGVPEIVLHAFTDGRDTLPDSGAGYVAEAEEWLAAAGGRVAERDRALLRDGPGSPLGAHEDGDGRAGARGGRGPPRRSPARRRCVRPTSAARPTSSSSRSLVGERARIEPGDAVLFFNFRPDRARQLTQALTTEMDLDYVTLTEYREDWDFPVAFPPERPATTLAKVLERRGLGQLHVAETEKYPHVTYFFNGGEENAHGGEERCLVDSPRDVPTYDHKPEMSAREATAAFVDRWGERDFALRDHQLRQPGHGGPHRRDPGRGQGDRDRGRMPRPGGGGGARRRAASAS